MGFTDFSPKQWMYVFPWYSDLMDHYKVVLYKGRMYNIHIVQSAP